METRVIMGCVYLLANATVYQMVLSANACRDTLVNTVRLVKTHMTFNFICHVRVFGNN